MDFHFNLYESRHYGMQLNHIDNQTYQQFINGEDEELMVITLNLDPKITQYWINIPEDYDCFNDNIERIKIYLNDPKDDSEFLFHLVYDRQKNEWQSTTC